MTIEIASTGRWIRRPKGSTWGDYGPDDQLGRLNLLSPAKVKEGIAEVVEGRTFCLSLPLDCPYRPLSPRRPAPELRPTYRGPDKPNMNYPMRLDTPTATDIVSDDQAVLTLQYSTHWDSLAHVGQMFDVTGEGTLEDVYYNGYRAGTDVVGPVVYSEAGPSPTDAQPGARRLGIENMAVRCVQGRAVMIDLEAHFGATGRVVTYEDLARIMSLDGVTVSPGDLVCLRTGFARRLLQLDPQDDPAALLSQASALDGRDERLQQWITDSGLVALIADNYAVEALPAKPGAPGDYAALPLHEHCLFRLGVYLGELWYLDELADWLRAQGRFRFLLTAPPLRLPGAVGSPVTPIATV